MTMNNYSFGDIVLLAFPYTNQSQIKKCPALVLCDTNDNDVIVCRVTSKLKESEFDIAIENWEEIGLKMPSIIRLHKVATIEKSIIEKSFGKITSSYKNKIISTLALAVSTIQ